MEAKFKVGGKVEYTYNYPESDGYEHNKVYTVKSRYYSRDNNEWTIETEETDSAGRWQWKFDFTKSHIVSSILRDL